MDHELFRMVKELENDLEEVHSDREEREESELPRRRLNKEWISVPELVYEDEENLDDLVEPSADLNDKIGKKRQREAKDNESLLEKKKKKKKDSVSDEDKSAEIEEMWDSITNNNSKEGDNAVVNSPKKDNDDDDDEIRKLFDMGRKKSKKDKNTAVEIARQVEEVMANLEIAAEDDAELNREGKPAVNKLIKLPLLNGALSKKQLQAEFLDHGVLNLLKNWLEPLPDGSLPNINIRSAVLNILNHFSINLDQESRREQLINSGLGKVIKFLSKSEEETTPNRRLANDLINRWGHLIYNKSTRYVDMCSRAEREEQHEMLLRRQNKIAPKVSTKARDFDVDIDFSMKPKSKLAASQDVGRARVPRAMSMDFMIRPKAKFDRELEARAKMQIDNSFVHDNIIYKLERIKALKRKSLQAIKPSVDGRSMLKYL